MASRTKQPSILLIPMRVLLVTILAAMLSFAVSLLLGIFGIVVVAGVRGFHPDLRFAYKHVALPVAIAVAAAALVGATVLELRHYRQAKALAAIERLS